MVESHPLLSRIEDSFGHAKRPEDEQVVRWPSEGEMGDILDLERTIERFKGKRWQDVTTDFAENDPQEMLSFSPEGFGYYLPAWMSLYLKDPDAMEGVLEVLLFSVTGAGGESSDRALRRTSHLDDAQKACFLDFLTYISETHPNHLTREDADAAKKMISGVR
jgi:hypothetical protein